MQRPSAGLVGQYPYLPLRDASKCIRLLRVCHVSQTGQSASYKLTEHAIVEAPKYAAISYTWGSNDTQHDILIDHYHITVNHNAFYALQQVRDLHRKDTKEHSSSNPIEYLWMDTLCINQQDLAEKGLQVEMMAEIYADAGMVYACVGPQADHSEVLCEVFDAIRDFQAYDRATGNPLDDDIDYDMPVEWLLSQDESHLSNIFGAFAKFAHRAYWSRMWIVQELCKGVKCSILCGSDAFMKDDLLRLETSLELLLEDELPLEWRYDLEASWAHANEGLMFTTIRFDRWNSQPLGSILELTKDFGCHDSRDRIYALNAMIQWGEHQSRLRPDYVTKSAFDVLVQAIGHVNLSETELRSQKMHQRDLCSFVRLGMLEALAIDSSHVRIRKAVEERRQHGSKSDTPGSREPYALLRETSYAFDRLSRNHQGGLKVNFHRCKADQPKETTKLLGAFHGLSKASTHDKPRLLFVGAEVAGIACVDVQEDDYLYPLDVQRAIQEQLSQLYLVIRCRDVLQDCTIIGQAIIFAEFEPDIRFPTWTEFEESGYKRFTNEPIFELKLTAEDVLVLVGQDFVIQSPSSKKRTASGYESRLSRYDIQQRFFRLATAVSVSSDCGTRIVRTPTIDEEICAIHTATHFAQAMRVQRDRAERSAFQISQTHTGFAFMEESVPVRHFAGPVTHSPGGVCPAHGASDVTKAERSTSIFEVAEHVLPVRNIDCTCHLETTSRHQLWKDYYE